MGRIIPRRAVRGKIDGQIRRFSCANHVSGQRHKLAMGASVDEQRQIAPKGLGIEATLTRKIDLVLPSGRYLLPGQR
jgi:hypothetical protein